MRENWRPPGPRSGVRKVIAGAVAVFAETRDSMVWDASRATAFRISALGRPLSACVNTNDAGGPGQGLLACVLRPDGPPLPRPPRGGRWRAPGRPPLSTGLFSGIAVATRPRKRYRGSRPSLRAGRSGSRRIRSTRRVRPRLCSWRNYSATERLAPRGESALGEE